MAQEVLKGPMLFDCSSDTPKYKCRTCPNFQTDLLVSLKDHMEGGHESSSSEETVYKCLKCSFVAFSKFLVVRHSFFNECSLRTEDEREEFACYSYNRPNKSESSFHKESEDTHLLKSEHSTRESWEKIQVQRHVIFCQQAQRFACEHCPLKFKYKSELIRHKVSHSKPEDIQWIHCEQCQTKFKRKSTLTTHIKIYHCKSEDIQWFQCDQCPSKFKRKNGLKRHKLTCHSKSEDIQWINCEQCLSKFRRKSAFIRHIKIYHDKSKDIQWFQCDQCPSKCKRKRGLKRHKLTCHSKPEDIQWMQCDQCPYKSKKTNGGLTAHKRSCHPIQDLSKIIKMAHEVLKGPMLFDCSSDTPKYKCRTCPNFQTDLLVSLKDHMEGGHESSSSEETVYKCLKCAFVTFSKFLMVRHSFFNECSLRTEDEREEFACYSYNRPNKSESSFHNESEDTHLLKSEHSTRESWEKIQLRRHVMFCHSNSEQAQQFDCEHCPLKFKYKSEWIRHKVSHLKPEDIQWIHCEQCPSKFKRKSTLTYHIKIYHCESEDIQWFQCDQCPSKFKRKNGLERHKLTCHSKSEDIQWIQCDQCPYKRKKTNGGLKAHKRSRHPTPEDIEWFKRKQHLPKIKQKRDSSQHIKRSRPSKPKDAEWFKCEQCPSKFKRKPDLELHVKLCHSGHEEIKWFDCEQCTAKFKLKATLSQHVILCHSNPE